MLKIISIVDQPITPRLRKLCGEEYFESVGITSIVIDWKDPALRKIISNCDGNTIFNFYIALNWRTHSIYRAMSESPGKYVVYQMATHPNTNHYQKPLISRIMALSPFHILEGGINLLLLSHYRFFGIKTADFAIVSGTESKNIRRDPISENTIFIKSHIPDYDLYLKERFREQSESDTIVFIDEFLPYHPDIKTLGLESPITPDKYYQSVRKFFDLVEKTTGYEVIIAAHPKSDYSNYDGRFGGRSVLKNLTPSLIHLANFVIAHDSTAISLAILFEKPLLIITTDEIEKCQAGRLPIANSIEAVAKKIGKRPLNIDRAPLTSADLDIKVNLPMYHAYKREIIKSEGSPDIPFWQIYLQEISKCHGLQL